MCGPILQTGPAFVPFANRATRHTAIPNQNYNQNDFGGPRDRIEVDQNEFVWAASNRIHQNEHLPARIELLAISLNELLPPRANGSRVELLAWR